MKIICNININIIINNINIISNINDIIINNINNNM